MTNTVPKGYKQIEVGAIPKEWQFFRLGDLLNYEQPTKYLVLSTNYDDKYTIPVVTAGKTFILGYTNEENGVFKNELPVIIFDDFTTATKFVDFPFKAKSSAMKILKAKKSINIKLVYELMQMIKFIADNHKRYWISEYQEIEIKMPSEYEQQKIADILLLWDEAIDKHTALIDKKQQLKKGLIQQLLTGKTRFREFTDEWQKVRLGDVAIKTSSNITMNKLKNNNGIYPVYGAIGCIKNIDFYTENEDYIAILKDGAGVGRVLLCESKSSVLGTLDIVRESKDINLVFMYFLLTSICFKKYIVGSGIPHIYYKDYSIEKIKLPLLVEQQKIAQVLSFADEEINQLKCQLKNLQTQKKGLMQQLLTGKIRVQT